MTSGGVPKPYSRLWRLFERSNSSREGLAPAPLDPGQNRPTGPRSEAGPSEQRSREDAHAARIARRLEARLKRPLRVALLGEFNSGKTTLARLLIGPTLDEVDLPSDGREATLFRYGEPQRSSHSTIRDDKDNLLGSPSDIPKSALGECYLPAELLRRLEFIDAPGTGNPLAGRDDESFLWKVAGCAHSVLWCTPATQAWTRHEQRCWLALPERLRSSSILVVMHADHIRNNADRDRILSRLRRDTAGQFRDVVMISARERVSTSDDTSIAGTEAYRDADELELLHFFGGARLWQCLMEALAEVMARREEAARRIVARAGDRRPGRAEPPHVDARKAVFVLWAHEAEMIAARLPQDVSVKAMLEALDQKLAQFARDTLKPLLEKNFAGAFMDDVISLFACDATARELLATRASAEDAKALLHQIMTQLTEELEEAL